MVRRVDRQARGYLRRPLNVLFAAPSHAAVLRALAHRARGASGMEIARAAGVAHQATLDSLARLETVGIVSRLPLGRGYLFSLNREHGLVQRGLLPLLDEESGFGSRLRELLRSAFEKDVVAGVIYGSAGRDEDRPESDLDVCLVVRRASAKERVLQRAAGLADAVWRGFGVRLSVVAYTESDFKAGLAGGKPLFVNIQRDGERFAGRPLERRRRG